MMILNFNFTGWREWPRSANTTRRIITW